MRAFAWVVLAVGLCGCAREEASTDDSQRKRSLPAPEQAGPSRPSVLVGKQRNVVFGTKPSAKWVTEQLGSKFRGNVIAAVQSNRKTYMLYEERTAPRKLPRLILAAFSETGKLVLWQMDNAFLSGLVPEPRVLTCHLDNNDQPDLIFCYTEDQGIGSAAENWTKTMYVFMDGGRERKAVIPMGMAEVEIDKDKGKVSDGTGKGPAKRVDCTAFLELDTKGRKRFVRIYVLSRTIRWTGSGPEHRTEKWQLEYHMPGDKTEHTVYQEKDPRLFLMKNIVCFGEWLTLK